MNLNGLDVIQADWPMADRVAAFTTTRTGGCSIGPWASLNLGEHCGDDPDRVAENRQRLAAATGLATPLAWLKQVHGTTVVRADPARLPEADAQWTEQPGLGLALLTADCLPVVLGDAGGQVVAVAHAGWRGLVAGILEASVAALPVSPDTLHAWIGPAIGPAVYEVGPEVRAAFCAADPGSESCFKPSRRSGHYLADLPGAARRRLVDAGIAGVHLSQRCTFSEGKGFFSHRRNPRGGRIATVAWLRPAP